MKSIISCFTLLFFVISCGVFADDNQSLGMFKATASSVNQKASDNSEGAKKISFGDVSVNLQSGQAMLDLSEPENTQLGISFSTSGYFSSGDDNTPFGIANGIALANIPYIFRTGYGEKEFSALSIQGGTYYIDWDFTSAVTCDNGGDGHCEYKSGLKYQTSKYIDFHKKSVSRGDPDQIKIYEQDKSTSIIKYLYVLKYANGTSYFFNNKGLCVLSGDKYFENSTENNYKNVTRFEYKSLDSNVFANELAKITFPNGTYIDFIYDSNAGYLKKISYPANASGQRPTLYFDVNGRNMAVSRIYTRFDEKYNIGYSFETSSQAFTITEGLYKPSSNRIFQSYIEYDFAFSEYDDGVRRVRQFTRNYSLTGEADKNSSRIEYLYELPESITYKYGADISLENALNKDLNKEYMATTVYTKKKNINQFLFTRHVYNSFQQEIRTQSYLAKSQDGIDKKLISVIYNLYKGKTDNTQEGLLDAAYNMPVTNYTVVLNGAGESALRASEIQYDDYAQTLKQIYYSAIPYDFKQEDIKTPPDISVLKGLIPEAIIENKYNYEFLMQTESKISDCSQGGNVNDCESARVIMDNQVLTTDARNVASEYTEYQILNDGQGNAYSPVTSYSYATNNKACDTGNYFYTGLICSQTTRLHDQDKSYKTKPWQLIQAYSYQTSLKDDALQLSTTTSVSAADYLVDDKNIINSSEQLVSINGQTTSIENNFLTFLNGNDSLTNSTLETQTEYNLSGLPIVVIDENGNRVVSEYDPVNLTVTKSLLNTQNEKLPLSMIKYDPLGNVLEQYEYSSKDDVPYLIEQNIYDYSYDTPLLVKTRDTYKNLTEYHYDDQVRLISTRLYQNTKANGGKANQGDNSDSLKLIDDSRFSYDLDCNEEYGCYQILTTTNNLTGLTNKVHTIGKGDDGESINFYSENSINGRLINSQKSVYTRTNQLLSTSKYTYGDNNTDEQLISRTEYFYNVYGLLKKLKTTAFNTDYPVESIAKSAAESKVSYLHYFYDDWSKSQDVYKVLSEDEYYDANAEPEPNSQLKDYVKTYDILGREIRLSYELDDKDHYNDNYYDGLNRIINTRDFMGNAGKNVYNLKGLLNTASYNGSTASQEIEYNYDDFARLKENILSIGAKEIGSVIYHFNKLSLPQGHSFTGDYTVDMPAYNPDSVERDTYNRVIKYTDKNQLTYLVSYRPDGVTDEVIIKNDKDVKVGRQKTTYYAYEPSNGMYQGKTHAYNIEFTANGKMQKQVVVYQYNDLALPETVTTTNTVSDKQNITVVTYAYDDQQRIKVMEYKNTNPDGSEDLNANKTTRYHYDALNRLIKSDTTFAERELTQSMVYDYYGIMGDIKKKVVTQSEGDNHFTVTTTYSYNDIRQLLEKNTTSSFENGSKGKKETTELSRYTYDLNGNLIEEFVNEDGEDSIVARYDYDVLNQMVGYTQYEKGAEVATYSYGYYPGGHRAYKSSNNETIAFLYSFSNDLQNEALIQNSELKLEKLSSYMGPFRYINDISAADEQVQMSVSDLINSPLTVVSTAKDNEIQSYNITPYGQLQDVTVENGFAEVVDTEQGFDFDTNPYIYASGYYDSESGLQFMESRYYSGDIERFMSQDTWDLLNRYNYANANPIVYHDPDGHMAAWLQLTFDVVSSAAEIAVGAVTGSPSFVMSGVNDAISVGFDIADIAQYGWDYDNGNSIGGYWLKKSISVATNSIGASMESSINSAASGYATAKEWSEGTKFAFKTAIGAGAAALTTPINEVPDIVEAAVFEDQSYNANQMLGNVALSAVTSVVGSFINLGVEKLKVDKVFSESQFAINQYGIYTDSLDAFEKLDSRGYKPNITFDAANDFADFHLREKGVQNVLEDMGNLDLNGYKNNVARDYKNVMIRRKLDGLPSKMINTVVIKTSDYVVKSTTGTGWKSRFKNQMEL